MIQKSELTPEKIKRVTVTDTRIKVELKTGDLLILAAHTKVTRDFIRYAPKSSTLTNGVNVYEA